MKNIGKFMIFGLFVGLLSITSCRKDYYVIEEVEINEPVFFAEDVLPIFDASCNMDGCHNTGGIPPDLTPMNAYNNLYLYNLVDTLNPELSGIYEVLISPNDPMPPSGQLNQVEIATVLAWIKQGGLNN